MGALHPVHLAFVLVVALLVFGPRRLPELARGAGDAIKELRKTLHGANEPEAASAVLATNTISEVTSAAAPDSTTADAPPNLAS